MEFVGQEWEGAPLFLCELNQVVLCPGRLQACRVYNNAIELIFLARTRATTQEY